MAVWHSAPLADSRTRDEVRVLKLAAKGDAAFDAAIAAVEAAAAKAGIRRIAVRCQSRYARRSAVSSRAGIGALDGSADDV